MAVATAAKSMTKIMMHSDLCRCANPVDATCECRWVPREEGREPRDLGRDGRGGAVPNRRAVPQERSVGRRRGAILGRAITA